MKVSRLKIRWVLVLALTVVGCTSGKIDYTSSRVDEEERLVFTRITDSPERVCGPRVTTVGDTAIYYFFHKWFDISRDGARIVYLCQEGSKRSARIKQFDGSKPTLVRDLHGIVNDICFSPDSKSLAFSTYLGDKAKWELCVADVDTPATVRRLVTHSDDIDHPLYSPRDNSLLFVLTKLTHIRGATLGTCYLQEYNFEKKSVQQWVDGETPSYFPDGKRVAFSRGNSSIRRREMWVLDLSNGHQLQITASRERSYQEPAVSPDGQRIAFVARSLHRNAPPNLDIGIMNIDGSQMHWLTFHPGHDICPQWSPDGKSIYFLSQRGTEKGEWNIWRAHLND